MRRLVALSVLFLVVGSCRRESKPLSSNLNLENRVSPRTIALFYESSEMLLVPERRDVPLPENAAGAVPAVIRELLKGPVNAAVPRLFPADAALRAAYFLPDGTVFVDLGGPTLTQGWSTGSHQELMAVYSLVQTITTNFPQSRRVRLLVNGVPAETLGGHVSLARSLTPNPRVVAR